MEPYKKKFYKNYYKSHLITRKGVPTSEMFDLYYKVYKKNLSSLLPKDKSVNILDVGCGYGTLLSALHTMGYKNAMGIELSEELVTIGEQFGVQNIYRKDLFDFLKNNNTKFSIIIFKDILEHFTRDEINKILELTRELLADSGEIIIHVPNAESPYFGRIRYGDYTHELAFTRSSIAQTLSQFNFGEIQYREDKFTVHGLRSFIRSLLWSAFKFLYKLSIFAETGDGNAIVTQNFYIRAKKQ